MYQTQQQNYGYQQPYPVSRPTYQGGTMPYPGIKGRPVASFEEARASIIDFDGSVFYFPDLANKRIYTKQINMDGTALMNMYELKELPTPTPEPIQQSNFVTKEELEQAITQLRENLTTAYPVPQTKKIEELKLQPEIPLTLNF